MRNRFSGMIGNFLEHYDNALFGLLAPFIAPLFFETADPLTALILTYGMIPLGYLARPLGSLFFGFIGDRLGRRQALSFSLLGMAIATVGIGCLPVYREIGIFAPILLGVGRLFQSFFAAGETSGGAIFVLEGTEASKRGLMSSLFGASSIGGIIIASALVTLYSDDWRCLFWAGGITGIIGVIVRLKTDGESVTQPKTALKKRLKGQGGALLSIALASGFSYTTYSFAFTLMNGYVPLVTSITKTEVMELNTALLCLDMILLPCFGFLAQKIGKQKVMLFGALGACITAIPIFYWLPSASFTSVLFIRLAILIFGVAFSAPYYAWSIEQVPSHCRYTVLSLGSSLGAQFIGAPVSVISLWLYQQTGWVVVPGVYLSLIAFAATIALLRPIQKLTSEVA